MRAALFPGQGVAAKDLAAALDQDHPRIEEANQVLGYDFVRAVEQVAHRSLPTTLAQPAILVSGIVSFENALARPERFDFMVGHSLGEYTALVAGGALSFADGLKVVVARARAMQRAVRSTGGGMVALLRIAPDEAARIADRAGVSVANDNSPTQTVVAGDDLALARVATLGRAAGARCLRLPVEGAFHTTAMNSAADALADVLAHVTIRSPKVTVLSNVSAAPYRSPGEVRKLLVRQLTSKVRFRESIEYLAQSGVTDFIDLGPGRVVEGLALATAQPTDLAAHV
jgi:[acyl-carrier-protein] S-malonyltransferase